MANFEFTSVDITKALRDGHTSVENFLKDLLKRVRDVNKKYKIYAQIQESFILEQAKLLDGIKKDGCDIGQLFGVPFSVSDNLDTCDFYTELGSKIYRGRQPLMDSTIVKRLKQANAIIIGKTQVSEFLENLPTISLNPINKNKNAGGSMSGTAISVATGTASIGIGSQTGGSIISCASYYGIYGFKPSRSLVPCSGLKQISFSLDSIGYFSRSISDLSIVLETISGDDNCDKRTESQSLKNFSHISSESPPFPPKFICFEDSKSQELEPVSKKAFNGFIKKIKKHLTKIDLPGSFRESHELFETIMDVEITITLKKEFEEYKELLNPLITERIVRGKKISGFKYLNAKKKSKKIKSALMEFFEHFDAIIAPTIKGRTTFENDTKSLCFSDFFAIHDFPILSLPLLTIGNSLPYGIQLVGAPGDDARLIRTASWLVENYGGS